MIHTVLGTKFNVTVINPSEAMTFTDMLDALLRAGLDDMQARAAIRDDEREREKFKEYDPTVTP